MLCDCFNLAAVPVSRDSEPFAFFVLHIVNFCAVDHRLDKFFHENIYAIYLNGLFGRLWLIQSQSNAGTASPHPRNEQPQIFAFVLIQNTLEFFLCDIGNLYQFVPLFLVINYTDILLDFNWPRM